MLQYFFNSLKSILLEQQRQIAHKLFDKNSIKRLQALRADIESNICNNYIKIPKPLWSNFLEFQYRNNRNQTLIVVAFAWLIHICYGITDAIVMPDMIPQILAIRVVSAIICIPILLYVMLKKTNVYIWDLTGISILTAVGLCWFWLVYNTQSTSAPSYIYATLIFILIATAFVQSSARIAILNMLIMTVGAVYIVQTRYVHLQKNAMIGFITAFIPMVMFCMYSCWRNVQTARKHFLEKVLDELKVNSLASSNRSLHNAATTDPLTNLANRRLFQRQCNFLWQKHITTGENFAVFIIDIDYFKTFNDTYGHPAGDVCLKRVAKFLEDVMVDGLSSTYRLGGEEFSVIVDCKRLNDLSINNLARQLVEGFGRLKIVHDSRPDALGYVTYSLGGCVSNHREHKSISDILLIADQMLYQAKKNGRNQACIYNLATTSSKRALRT